MKLINYTTDTTSRLVESTVGIIPTLWKKLKTGVKTAVAIAPVLGMLYAGNVKAADPSMTITQMGSSFEDIDSDGTNELRLTYDVYNTSTNNSSLNNLVSIVFPVGVDDGIKLITDYNQNWTGSNSSNSYQLVSNGDPIVPSIIPLRFYLYSIYTNATIQKKCYCIVRWGRISTGF